jgi:hypothetical protein
VGAERGGDRGAAVEQLARAIGVSLDAGDAPCLHDVHRPRENVRGVQRVPRHDRHHHVQFELSTIGGGQDRSIAADHLIADLIHHLGDRRVHLAGHDRRSRLHGGQFDFRDPRTRPHAQESQIGCDFADFHREPAQRA